MTDISKLQLKENKRLEKRKKNYIEINKKNKKRK